MMKFRASLQKVHKIVSSGLMTCACKSNEPMMHYASFGIGGPVSLMFFPECQTELIEVCSLLGENDIKPLVLGRGTNLLVDDKPLDIVVINTLKLDRIKIAPVKSEAKSNSETSSEAEILAEAGVGLNVLATFAYEHGLTGLEFAHGIPGTLGGGIIMNAGAYGGEMKDIVNYTTAFSFENGLYTLHGSEHEFGYRSSRFIYNHDVIISAGLRLRKADPMHIKAKMDDFSKRRHSSQPLDSPSAGSTFKRPAQGYAASLIEQAGLKGYAVGGAEVSRKHAGFIINHSNATFSDVVSIMEHVQEEVLKQFNVKLEPEVKIIRNS